MKKKSVLNKEVKRKVGRPRIYKDDVEKVGAWRSKNKDKKRLDIYINSSAGWRLKSLAKAWGINRSQVIERLLMEADVAYEDLLFQDDK